MTRGHYRIALVTSLALGTIGCSWLVGVSEDPEVVDGPGTDAATTPETSRDASVADSADGSLDGSEDAPEDAEDEEAEVPWNLGPEPVGPTAELS